MEIDLFKIKNRPGTLCRIDDKKRQSEHYFWLHSISYIKRVEGGVSLMFNDIDLHLYVEAPEEQIQFLLKAWAGFLKQEHQPLDQEQPWEMNTDKRSQSPKE